MLLTLINLILSPFNLLFFIFFASTKNNSSRYFVSTSTNVSRLKALPYVLYNLTFILSILLLTYVTTLIFPDKIILWEVYQPQYYWLSILGWLVSIFTLSVYFKGMEGNIMGFIFFPMLLFSSLALLIANIASLFSLTVSIGSPGIDFNFWTRFALHAFLPSYILMFVNQTRKNDTNNNDRISPLTGSIILQLIFFCINWIIVKLFGTQLSFSFFFGEGQPILYYVPMMGGALYYLIFILTQFKSDRNKWKETIDLIALIIVALLILLQLFNYIKLIRECF